MQTNIFKLPAILLAFLLWNQNVLASHSGITQDSAKGRTYLHFGVGYLPYAGHISIHHFISKRISFGLDVNVGFIQATETYRTKVPVGSTFYYRENTRSLSATGGQFGIKLNMHLKKNPKKHDPYFALGIHMVRADYKVLDVQSGYKHGSDSYLSGTTNFFFPASIAIGWRWNHTKNLSIFSEIGIGSCVSKIGLYYRIK